ncbi:hypothetical protein [Magnetospirillum aberrantis]|uniref:Uncharacterized protein n=1 Tax=Magnetospirillum aberrantis SpK TaxID=908842 RepID=A0A7C9UTE3_9PROT|nr:hypothetical protein [Magnetospirillum aberrantis]NFV79988.1 hypothetical protein [Magnetospirillum aberrantis SpK]
MTELPVATQFTGSTATEGDQKTFITNLRAFLAGVLGTAGTAEAARTALGTPAATEVLTKAGNLSGLADAAVAKGNLGLTLAGLLNVAQSWTKPQRPIATDTRTAGGTVTLDFTQYQNFAITLSSALTLGAPTIDANCAGQKGTIRIIAGSYTTPGGWWTGLKRVSSDGTTTMASLASLPSSGVARLDYEVISTSRIAVAYSVEEA